VLFYVVNNVENVFLMVNRRCLYNSQNNHTHTHARTHARTYTCTHARTHIHTLAADVIQYLIDCITF